MMNNKKQGYSGVHACSNTHEGLMCNNKDNSVKHNNGPSCDMQCARICMVHTHGAIKDSPSLALAMRGNKETALAVRVCSSEE